MAEAAPPAEPDASDPAGARAGPARPRLVLATTILSSSLAFIDGSIVNVGLPAIGRDLGAGGAGLSWVVNAYLLPLSALLLVGGAAGDLYGRRRLLVGGVCLFALACVVCALASSVGILIAGRVLQGLAAAAVMPNSLSILGVSFAGEARGRAVGLWAAVGAAAGAIGPLVGGGLIDAVGWRAVFLVNLPVAGAAVALAALSLDDDRPTRAAPLDLLGAALCAAALAALALGLTSASEARGLDAASGWRIAVGAGLLPLFVAVEHARREAAMMPLSLFASRSFVGLTVATLLLYAALGGFVVVLPTVLIEASGYSATAAGAALLPLPILIALGSSWMGRLAGRIGARLPLTLGSAIVAAGLAAASMIDGAGGYASTVLPALLLVSLGLAVAVAPLTAAVLASVEPRRTGVASGLNSAVARAGGLVATALASGVLAARGPELLPLAHAAALAGAALALAAGVIAFALLPGGRAGGG